ncbi:MAG TPA: DLW-39 family protein [Amycolatopsis sp.]|uniref:DLW-39 family protein n=1 Tax=Amycolatopsis sp. TaxID=37632 RepID=UPI002B46F17C|nr:DLW-39 family protein [Amycolatopsis sp.]HKS48757.1 DLW-39 family protein [Amycolatopsis sp.]
MKKLLALAVVAGGVLFVIKRNKDAKAEADLWREATAPTEKFGSASANGSAPAKTAEAGQNN